MTVSIIENGAGIGGRLRAAGLAEHAFDLGEALDDPVLHLQQPLRLRSTEMPGSVDGM